MSTVSPITNYCLSAVCSPFKSLYSTAGKASLRKVGIVVVSSVLAFASLPAVQAQTAAEEMSESISQVENSIVKIYTTSSAPDYFTPWRLLNPSQSTGSGTVIEGNRILTNAHVIANASYIQVQKHNDSARYLAEVSFVSHASDLALLTVFDENFFTDMTPLEIGTLPPFYTEVTVLGYPVGGRTLSITKGILSRVEQQVYAHSGEYLLAGQIDAAINPGNSGGPVIVDGKIAGVVMQQRTGGEALGYFVPPEFVRHMLTDSKNGINNGFPDLGFRTQNLESPIAKQAYGLNRDQNGVLIIKILDSSPASGVLQERDVLLSVDGYDVAGDSSIRLGGGISANYKHAIDLKQIGDLVEVTFVRDGEMQTATLMAGERGPSHSLVREEEFDSVPDYLVYGGIVFVPLNMNLIKRWGRDWSRTAPIAFLNARNQWSTPEQRELVVALQVLAADVNLGYHDLRNWVVESINGQPVRDFEQFKSLLAEHQQQYTVFRNIYGYEMILDHDKARASEADILARYRIPAAQPAVPAPVIETALCGSGGRSLEECAEPRPANGSAEISTFN